MSRRRWHIQQTDAELVLSRRLPARFDVAAEAVLPAADPLRLAQQVRQDMWRALQSLRGFCPVVSVRRDGGRVGIRAGGELAGRVPGNARARIQAVLDHPGNRARWLRFARARGGAA
jgi:hypothetical protein